MLKWLKAWRDRAPQFVRREPVFRALPDMTTDDQIRELVRWGERALEQGYKVLVLDLSDAISMDSGLIAGIILLSRRARPRRATLKLVGYSEQFESLMKIYKVWTPLAQSGVILQPKEHAAEDAPAQPGTGAVRAQSANPETTTGPGADRVQPRPAV